MGGIVSGPPRQMFGTPCRSRDVADTPRNPLHVCLSSWSRNARALIDTMRRIRREGPMWRNNSCRYNIHNPAMVRKGMSEQ